LGQGAVDAAASSRETCLQGGDPDDRLHMVMDKPFIFALRNRASGLILVAGCAGHAPAERSTP